ncbi:MULTISPECIES: glycosyltransferase [Campylobacter]|uniref:glycosyltransferase n=1 Tax=Campylobacter TaxID=194 RepID=UPI00146FFBA7|nr:MULTISPECIES: glycosyltransferase [Campylobacter]MBN7288359.1 glycosyltransferase [Campylobacter curvus]MDU6827436.1 glycosyltransferase [Campylobacter sp.]
MKSICFWVPYVGNIGTIKATLNGANAIKKYYKSNINIIFFKIYREWNGYDNIIHDSSFEIVDFKLHKYFKNLPEFGLASRFTMLLIMFYSMPKLIKYFNKQRPDIIFSYLQGITPVIARFFSKHKPKIILSIQGLPSFMVNDSVYNGYPFWKKIEANIRIMLWKLLYLKADKLIVLTELTRLKMIDFLKSDADKIIYVPNPVIDESIYQKSLEDIDNKGLLEKYIIAVGRLTAQKDFRTLIRAFNIVSKQNNINLLILGEGEDREKLQKMILDLKLENRVILYGFAPNPYKFIRKASLFVLSSLWEDPGHVLMEAAYLKIPIVATNCPNDVDKFLMYGKAGYLCEISNARDMADKIILALNNNNDDKVQMAYENSLLFSEFSFSENIKGIIS